MAGQGGIIRKKRSNFAQVSNYCLQDDSISLKAKGLYSLIQSYISIPNFTLYKTYLMTKCLEKESAFGSAWKELKDKGYLTQTKIRDVTTGHYYYEYELLDEPINSESPHPDFPGVDNPCMGEPHVDLPAVGKEGTNNSISELDLKKDNLDNNLSINNNIYDRWTESSINYLTFDDFYSTFSKLSTNEDVSELTYQELFLFSQQLIAQDDLNEYVNLKLPLYKDISTNIIEMLIDVFASLDTTMLIGKSLKNSNIVKNKFLKLNLNIIIETLYSLNSSNVEMSNPESYLKTALYNACAGQGIFNPSNN